MLRCFAQLCPTPTPGICCFVRIIRNCTLSCGFVGVVSFRDFEGLKVIMRNPVDFPLTLVKYTHRNTLFVFTLKIN